MKYFLLTIFLGSLLLFNESVVISSAGRQSNLQLCPPGGQSFQNALYLICGFNKKGFFESQDPSNSGRNNDKNIWEEKRRQIERKCCFSGCDFMNLSELCFFNNDD